LHEIAKAENGKSKIENRRQNQNNNLVEISEICGFGVFNFGISWVVSGGRGEFRNFVF